MIDFCAILFILFAAFILRVMFLLYKILTRDCELVNRKTLRTAMCIGSGGHTTELLRIQRSLNMYKYAPRLYILAERDVNSEVKIHKLEQDEEQFAICRIPRSRNVDQSYQSSVITTLYATLYTIPVIYNFKPNVIICNGPGTCIPVCVVAFLFRCLFLIDCRIVFIESICRVRTLSLTGKILQCFADLFIVQWPELRDACFRAKYFGRLS